LQSSTVSAGGSAIERREYLIDHFHVFFQGGSAWQCACREFAAARACRHTREAAGMREAQAQIAKQVLSGTSKFWTAERRLT
jgi:hypothetical protein